MQTITTSLNGRELFAVSRPRVECDLTFEGKTYRAEIETRGNSSRFTNKKGYNVRFTEKVSIFGMSARTHWVFLGEEFDDTYMRNPLTYTLGSSLRVIAPEIKSFVLQVTEPKGPFFWGLYSVTYKPTLEDIGADALIQFDRPDPKKNLWEPEPGCGVAAVLEEWNPEKYGSREEAKAALAPLYRNATVADLDLKTFVDYFLINELSSNGDAYVYSAYTYVRDGKIYAGFLWDFNISYGNNFDVYEPFTSDSPFWHGKFTHLTDVWRYYHNFKFVCSDARLAPTSPENYIKPGNEKLYEAITKNIPNEITFSLNCVSQQNISAWMMLLVRDPTFIRKVTKRWSYLRCNVFAYKNIVKVVECVLPHLQVAAEDIRNWYQRELANVTKIALPISEPCAFYEQTVQYLLCWIRKRINWLDVAIGRERFITSKRDLNNWDNYWVKLNRNDYPLIAQEVPYKR